ncbi:MAG: DMT family transporter [Clostridium sp.]
MLNFLSIFIGGLIAIMLSFNSILAQNTGTYISTVIIHMAGLTTLLIIMIIKKYKITLKKGLPILLYSGGAIGIITVVCNTISIGAIGATLTISLGLLGQVISSIIIDHFGLLEVTKVRFNKKKFFGLSLMILGIIIMTIY